MKRRLAKIIYWLSGKLSRIQTMQQMYTLEGEPAGKVKLPCEPSLRLLGWSMQLDWKHWDHWATRREGSGIPCECGGLRDP